MSITTADDLTSTPTLGSLLKIVQAVLGSQIIITGAMLDTANDGVTAYYNGSGSVVSSTGVPTLNDARAVPFWSGSGGVISELAFNVTIAGGAGALGKSGLYNADPVTLKPTTLIVDSGDFDCTAATLKNVILNPQVVLAPNTLYYLVSLFGVAAPTVTTVTSGLHLFGRDNTLGAQICWRNTNIAYGPLPTKYGTPTGFGTSNVPMVCARWANYTR